MTLRNLRGRVANGTRSTRTAVIRAASVEHLSVARRLLLRTAMCRYLVILCLTVASAAAWAQSAGSTDQAQAVATSAERSVNQLAARRQALAARFQEQTDAIKRLMDQPRSWNRDRDVASAKGEAAETANQLAVLDRDLRVAADRLTQARRAWLAAIDAEMPTATAGRRSSLTAMRGKLAPQVKTPPKKIILPDLTLDRNADPEDLDQQAAAIRDAESQLSAQIAGLDARATEHEKNAELLLNHMRAKELDLRDDNQAHRIAAHATGGTGAGGAGDAFPTAQTPSDGGRTSPSAAQTVETDAPIVLQGVIDAATIAGLTRAQNSGDPATRAKATRNARDAVKARLEQSHKTRQDIEKRANELRQKKK
jgi:hypothetical protein